MTLGEGLWRGDSLRPRARADPSDGQKNIQNADAAHCAAKRGMKNDGYQRRVVAEKKVLFPIAGPRQIQEQCAHFESNNDQKCAINSVHGSAEFRRRQESFRICGWASEEQRCLRPHHGSRSSSSVPISPSSARNSSKTSLSGPDSADGAGGAAAFETEGGGTFGMFPENPGASPPMPS